MSGRALAVSAVDHATLTVTDLDLSERFYADVLGLVPVFDFGTGRALIHRRSGFTLGLITHPGTGTTPFDHERTGLDHLGFAAETREELEAWEAWLRQHGVEHTPIRDMELGHHLNFRDPDRIALEISAPTALLREAQAMLAAAELTDEQIRAAARAHFGMPEHVVAEGDAAPRP